MPFLRVDAYEGRSKEQVKELLDAIHRAILSAFGVPLRDRYQVYEGGRLEGQRVRYVRRGF
jgi:hypothetical protein